MVISPHWFLALAAMVVAGGWAVGLVSSVRTRRRLIQVADRYEMNHCTADRFRITPAVSQAAGEPVRLSNVLFSRHGGKRYYIATAHTARGVRRVARVVECETDSVCEVTLCDSADSARGDLVGAYERILAGGRCADAISVDPASANSASAAVA